MAIVYARAPGQVEITLESVDPASATFDNAPAEGDLLVVHAMERSGGDAANFTITDTGSDTGWIKRVAETTLQGNSQARRTHVVWTKVVDATDAAQGTYTITVDDGTASGKRMLMEEYEAGAAVTWTFEDVAVANTGTGSGSPLASGSTSSTSGEQLLIGSTIWRTGSSTMSGVAFSGLSDLAGSVGGNNGFTVMSAWAQDVTTGTKSTTVSFDGGTDAEGNIALLVFSAIEAGGGTPVGQVTETDIAQAIGSAKTKTLGQSTETDSAEAVTSAKTKLLGQSIEADQAQPITALKALAVGQAVESDLAQSVTFVGAIPVDQAVESDTALPITARKARTIGQVTETDAAQAVTFVAGTPVGQASETDQALAITARKIATLGQATETDSALALGETEIEPIVLPPYREPAAPDFQESAVPAYRETSTSAYQETA